MIGMIATLSCRKDRKRKWRGTLVDIGPLLSSTFRVKEIEEIIGMILSNSPPTHPHGRNVVEKGITLFFFVFPFSSPPRTQPPPRRTSAARRLPPSLLGAKGRSIEGKLREEKEGILPFFYSSRRLEE